MFQVRPFEPKTINWWRDEQSEIDFDPPYQRSGRIWSKQDKAFLIDSILNDFDIPKFYLADFTYASTPLNRKRKKFAVIDGKQRFEAILDFFSGKLTLDANFLYLGDPSLKLAGLSYRDLTKNHPKIARKFENFSINVMSVITDDEGKINELFVRLNNSKPLTGAEVRNAMKGPIPILIREIASHSFFQSKVAFSRKRMQERNAAAKLLLVEYRSKLVDTKKPHLDKLVDEGVRAENTDFGRAAKRAKVVLDRLDHIFAPKDPLLASQGPITAYYWLVRSAPRSLDRFIRPFLLELENKRKLNRRRQATGDPNTDKELLAFDLYSRSTNDQTSLSSRVRLLEKWLGEYATS